MGKPRRPQPDQRSPIEEGRKVEPKEIHRKVTVSFEHYRAGSSYCLSVYNDEEQRKSFLQCLHKLTQRTWQQLLEQTSKDKALKTGLNPTAYKKSDLSRVEWPGDLAEEVTILGLRATDRRRIFGASINLVFYVLWFDEGHQITKG